MYYINNNKSNKWILCDSTRIIGMYRTYGNHSIRVHVLSAYIPQCYNVINQCIPGVVIITTPASPLPIELVATTENV